MTLQELLRSHSREPLESIQENSSLLQRYRQEQQAALTRARRTREEADRRRTVADERASSLRLVQSKITEIERQIQDLQSRLEERRRELSKCLQDHTDAEADVAEQRKQERNELDASEEFGEKIREAESALEKANARLQESRRAAMNAYLSDLWNRLLNTSSTSTQRLAAVQNRRRLERDRHEDPEVASLWEAREEWRRISNSSAPTLVLQTARAELARVEQQLNERYPGALESGSTEQGTTDVEELFFVPPLKGHVGWVTLPIPSSIWRSIESGNVGLAEDVAMRLIWTFARVAPHSRYNSEFFASEHSSGFSTDRPEEDFTRGEPLTLPLPGSGNVSFIVSPLPQELVEALRHEDSDK